VDEAGTYSGSAFIVAKSPFQIRIMWNTKPYKSLMKSNGPALIRASHRVAHQTARSMEEQGHKGYTSGPKTGRIYHRTNPTRVHRASAPGQAPASDLGDLARGIRVEDRVFATRVRIRIFNTQWYAWLLEFGHGPILPRPLWRGIWARGEQRLIAGLRHEMRRIARRSRR
jgi:hypothetical protein